MKQKRTAVILIAALAVVLAAAALLYPRLARETAPAGEGDGGGELPDPIPAVDFQLEDGEGTLLSFLELLDGRPAVVNFWAANCPPCREEMPHFQAAYEEYGEDIQFLMVNVLEAMGDTKEDAQAYLAQEGYTFPVYYDRELSGVMAYGLRGFPTTFFLNGDKELVLGLSGMMSRELLETYLSYAFPQVVPAPGGEEG